MREYIEIGILKMRIKELETANRTQSLEISSLKCRYCHGTGVHKPDEIETCGKCGVTPAFMMPVVNSPPFVISDDEKVDAKAVT